MSNLIRIEQIKATRKAWDYIFKVLKHRRAVEARLKARLGDRYTSWRVKSNSSNATSLKSVA